MQPRVTLITLGVADVARSRAFYEALGFKASSASQDEVGFLRTRPASCSGLFGEGGPVAHAHVPAQLARVRRHCPRAQRRHRVESRRGSSAEAAAAGAALPQPAQKVFWGGTSGHFADPDGHLWEAAHNPFFPLDEGGPAATARFRDQKHDSYPDTYIAGILNDCRVFAFVGASEKNNRPSHFAMRSICSARVTPSFRSTRC